MSHGKDVLYKGVEAGFDFLTGEHGSKQKQKQKPKATQEQQDKPKQDDAPYVYRGVETDFDFETMEEAERVIGGDEVDDLAAEYSDVVSGDVQVLSLDSEDEDIDELQDFGAKPAEQSEKGQKVFSFSMPMGGAAPGPGATSKEHKNRPKRMRAPPRTPQQIAKYESRKNEIKEKLKRNVSLTSLEEQILYQDETGIVSSRNEVVLKAFGLGSLRDSLKTVATDPNKRTRDGYTYGRLESIWDELEGDFIIMGGYRGSVLREVKTDRRVWLPFKAGLNSDAGGDDLLIGPKEEDEIAIQKKIKSDAMLTHVGPVDISKKLIKKLAQNPKVRIQDFGYDWRLSLEITSGHLQKKLESIVERQKKETGKAKGVVVIAHSMGGLVAHGALQRAPHLFRGLIYVGSPSQCPNVLGPLRFGDEIMLNKALLSKENNFFMRSSFHFLPFDGRIFVDKKTLERYDLDFFDPKVWIELGLSPLVNKELREWEKRQNEGRKKIVSSTSGPGSIAAGIANTGKYVLGNVPIVKQVHGAVHGAVSNTFNGGQHNKPLTERDIILEEGFKTPYEDCVDYLERTLAKAKKYLQGLEYDPSKKYPPLIIVYGNKVPTVRGSKVNGYQGIKDAEFNDFTYGPGDGVVHHKWLMPEQRGFPVDAKIASGSGHVGLMGDMKSMSKAFVSLVDAEKARAKSST